jgi:hypothetical protein
MLIKLKKWLFAPPKPRKVPKEEHYNLQELYHAVNARYFEGRLNLPIHWFGSRKSRPKYRIRFGTYNTRSKTIKIHRILDDPSVPDYFITFIIYHEILHHALPPKLRWGRRRQIHHAEFKAKEREFHDYALVEQYQKQLRKSWTTRLQLPLISEWENRGKARHTPEASSLDGAAG